jgi:hypothetical protein
MEVEETEYESKDSERIEESAFQTDLTEEELDLLVKISDAGLRYLRNHKGESPEEVLFAVLQVFHDHRSEIDS